MEYRKDALPNKTIGSIIDIFKNLNINFDITNEKSHKNLWWSLRIDLLDYENVGANGKGITRELAIASGLAETMERLQGGFLIEKYQPVEFGEYKNLLTGDIKLFSNKLIKIMCGTNGLSSGNSNKEAICQGFFEVLERHVLELFFMEKNNYSIGTFPKELFKNTRSYELILEIENNGLIPIVIDGTCGGMLPVLGIIILNPLTHSYLLNMASDFDVDICMSRCITELYQGRTMDTLLKKPKCCLNPIFSSAKNTGRHELYNQIIYSQGALPIETLYDTLTNISPALNLSVFKRVRSNEECYELVKNFCQKNDLDVYFCDLSFSDFYTCRVFIPGYSEIYEKDIEAAERVCVSIEKTKIAIKQYVKKQNSIIQVKNAIKELLKYDAYKHCFALHRFVPEGWKLHEELLSDDIMHVLSILSLYERNVDDAIIYAQNSQNKNNSKHIQFILWYLKNKKVHTDQLIDYYYKEKDGISERIRELEKIYNNDIDLFQKK